MVISLLFAGYNSIQFIDSQRNSFHRFLLTKQSNRFGPQLRLFAATSWLAWQGGWHTIDMALMSLELWYSLGIFRYIRNHQCIHHLYMINMKYRCHHNSNRLCRYLFLYTQSFLVWSAWGQLDICPLPTSPYDAVANAASPIMRVSPRNLLIDVLVWWRWFCGPPGAVDMKMGTQEIPSMDLWWFM